MVRLDAQDLRRAASVIVLLAVAAVALRSRGTLSSVGNAAAATAIRHGFLVFFGFLEGLAVLAYGVVLVLVFRRIRRRGQPEDNPANPLVPWWARVLGGLLAIAMVTVPAVLLVLAARGHRRSAGALGSPRPRPTLAQPGAHAADSSAWWLAGLCAVALAAIALAVLSAWLRSRRSPLGAFGAERPQDPLFAAASAGALALHSDPDPRRAIIACYAAMERSLSGAGAPPAAADTPAEVLDRAFGRAPSAPAETLTGLFRVARYSDHVLAEEHRTSALRALDALQADLAPGAGT
jgi:hypothetical protein